MLENVGIIMSKYTLIHMPNFNLLVIKEIQVNKISIEEKCTLKTLLVTMFWEGIFMSRINIPPLEFIPKQGSFVPTVC